MRSCLTQRNKISYHTKPLNQRLRRQKYTTIKTAYYHLLISVFIFSQNAHHIGNNATAKHRHCKRLGNMSGSGSFFSNSNSIDSSTTNSSSSTTSVNSINNDIFINNYSLLNNNNSANNLIGNGGGVSGTADLSNLNGNQFTAFGDFHPAVGGAAGSFCAGPGVQRTNGYSYFQNYQPGTSGTGGSSSLNFTSAANSATNNSYSGNVQWNLWQQFNQWPPHDPPAIFGGSMGSLSGNCQSKPSSTSLIRSHQHQPSPQPHLQNQQHQQPHHHSSNQNRWSKWCRRR